VAAPVAADEELDRPAIEAALGRAGGVIAQAAAALGLSRQALYRRMDKLGIPRE
jgi:DNA-binding NtrC family response regulator